jgi:hypothetical protein
MTTVASRTFRSIPHRNASLTWDSIVELLSQGKQSDARKELMSVAGIAASLIADQAPKDAPIIITCDGPRTRIYCSYEEDAVDGSGANENPLGYDPLKGNWCISLPCLPDDLSWIEAALKKQSSRITVRSLETGLNEPAAQSVKTEALVLDPKGFLGA